MIGLLSIVAFAQKGGFIGGIESNNQNYYLTATHSAVVCKGATSTLILAAASGQGQRMSFEMTNASSTAITLCKSANGCVVGLTIASTTGSYKQDDGYYGAYSCNANGTTSTIGIIYAQN